MQRMKIHTTLIKKWCETLFYIKTIMCFGNCLITCFSFDCSLDRLESVTMLIATLLRKWSFPMIRYLKVETAIHFVSLFLLFGNFLTCLKEAIFLQIITNCLFVYMFVWLDRKLFRSHVGGDTQLLLLKETMYILGEEAQMGNLELGIPLTGNCI